MESNQDAWEILGKGMNRNQIVSVRALEDCAENTYSQWGEDGLLNRLFSIIGTTNQTVIEIGAADGIFMSNSRALLEKGWKAYLIEKDEQVFAKLKKNCEAFSDRAVPILAEVTPHNINQIIHEKVGVEQPDYMTIDVDGMDYYIWNSLIYCRPRVIMIEHKPQHPDELPVYNSGLEGQAGVNVLKCLAASKGYQIVAITYTNLICVDNDIATKFVKELHAEA